MKCKNCGKTIPDDVIYCPNCGKKIESHLRKEDSVYVYKEPDDDNEEKKQSGGKSCLRTLISIILALLFVVLAFVAILKVAKNYLGEEPWNEKNDQTVQTEEESAPAKTMYISAEDGLLLRNGPGEDKEAVHILIKGEEVQAGQTENDWTHISADGVDGWCPAEYLTEDKIEAEHKEKAPKSETDKGQLAEPSTRIQNGFHGKVNAEGGLNLRCGPGQAYDIILVVPDKAEVVEEGRDGDWIFVKHDGEYGWIKLEYIIPVQAE